MNIRDAYLALETIVGPAMEAAATEERRRNHAPADTASELPPQPLSEADERTVAEIMALMKPYFDAERELRLLLTATETRAFRELSTTEQQFLLTDGAAWRDWDAQLELSAEIADRVTQAIQKCREQFVSAGRRMGEYLSSVRRAT